MGAAEGHSGECRTSLPAADCDRARGGKWYLDVLLWLGRGQLWELMWSMEVLSDCMKSEHVPVCDPLIPVRWLSMPSALNPGLSHLSDPSCFLPSFYFFFSFSICSLWRVCMGIITINLCSFNPSLLSPQLFSTSFYGHFLHFFNIECGSVYICPSIFPYSWLPPPSALSGPPFLSTPPSLLSLSICFQS